MFPSPITGRCYHASPIQQDYIRPAGQKLGLGTFEPRISGSCVSSHALVNGAFRAANTTAGRNVYLKVEQ
jgi:hypothetical protein